MSVGGPITTLEQLAQDLSSMRRRHAAEIASFLKRIDPVIFEEQDTEEILKPLTLSLAEKQKQTHRLLSVLGLPIPSTDQTTDQLINDLEKEKKLADEAMAQRALDMINMKSMVEAETIDVAVQTDFPVADDELDFNNITITKKTTTGRWSAEETALIHKCIPIFKYDYEAYLKIMPYVSMERLKRKVHFEHFNPNVSTGFRNQDQTSSRDNSQAPSQAEGSQADISSEGSDSEGELKWQTETRLRPRKQVHYIVEPLRSPSPKRSRHDESGSSSEDEPDSNANSSGT